MPSRERGALQENRESRMIDPLPFAAMAELVDALDSGSSRGNSVDVRVILAAITFGVYLTCLILISSGSATSPL